jgi:putative transposase
MTEIKSRGVNDILIAIVDGLKGFPEAINASLCRDSNPDLHCAFDSQFPGFLLLEGP